MFFALCNLVLAVANLLPREGLDGGRALFYFLLQRKDVGEAERICRAVSILTTVLLLGLLLLIYVLLGFNRGILLLCGLVALQLV